MAPKIQVCIVADRLQPPYDEGIKNIAFNFIREMAASHDATLISDHGTEIVTRAEYVQLGKTFINRKLASVLRRLAPELVFYIPSTSLTPASFLRAIILKLLSPFSRVYLIGLQTRTISRRAKLLLRLLGPFDLIVLSEAMRKEMQAIARDTFVFTPGVDLAKFSPALQGDKKSLRLKYGIGPDEAVILHVGHLKRSRNLQVIIDALQLVPCRLVVVASSTFAMEKDPQLCENLQRAGVHIIEGTIDAIEDFYRLSDCYVFPVIERTGATEMPLSVLEAMAVNLVVITTPYGALPELFSEDRGNGFYYATDSSSFAVALQAVVHQKIVNTRNMVETFSWKGRVADLISKIETQMRAND